MIPHTFSELSESPGFNTIILPIQSEDKEGIKKLNTAFGITGFNQAVDSIAKKNGKTTSLLHEVNDEIVRVILWNCEEENRAKLNSCVLTLAKTYADELTGDIAIDLSGISSTHASKIISILMRGIVMSRHDVGMYKTNKEKSEKGIDSVSIISEHLTKEEIETIFYRAKSAADTIMSCMALVNAPSNKKQPQTLADWMTKSSVEHGFNVNILNKTELEAQGFHALLAVNRGSEDPACCIVAEYKGASSDNAPVIALVGKGVTFDTGGMSVKPSQNMHYMKSDMGGAAAVMGSIELAAKLKVDAHIVAVIPCTDNSVGTKAIKPGDVISSYKGSTIEVIDTDAEGRLILADGLAYAIKNYNPDFIIDLATLTGSIVRTLGSHAAGLMTNSEMMAETLTVAGESSGDRVWRLPLWNDFDQYMKSDVADIRNLSTKPIGGAITAAKFLEHFTDEHPNWAHLDIAGTAFGTSTFSKGYSATGFGILLLLSWIENINQN